MPMFLQRNFPLHAQNYQHLLDLWIFKDLVVSRGDNGKLAQRD